MVAGLRPGAWTIERIYETFPRLAERKNHGGGQLSGGEQQMLTIGRALVTNPRLLIMDEPTEGLAPVIVAQVEDMLVQLGEDGDMSILVIEQNIGVATAVSGKVAIMVNGRINRIVESSRLGSDRDLQQRLLGVGRHADAEPASTRTNAGAAARPASPGRRGWPAPDLVSNPTPPTRWSQPDADRAHRGSARTISAGVSRFEEAGAAARVTAAREPDRRPCWWSARSTPRARSSVSSGTSSWQRPARAPRRCLDQRQASRPATSRRRRSRSTTRAAGARVRSAIAAPRCPRWRRPSPTGCGRQGDIVGIICAGGSGGASLVAPAMRALPIGVPKLLISSVASGDVGAYVGPPTSR